MDLEAAKSADPLNLERDVDDARVARGRLRALGWGLFVLFGASVARVAQLQLLAADRFFASLEETYVTFEEEPAPNGRILTRDGDPLAEDIPRYDVSVQYRWIEEPPSDEWIAAELRRRLTRKERKDAALVEQTRTGIEQEREAFWANVATICQVSQNELNERRALVQRRIEQMVASVEQRRSSNTAPPDVVGSTTEGESTDARTFVDRWAAVWTLSRQYCGRLIRELTTPPQPAQPPGPPVLKEHREQHTVLVGVAPEAALELRELAEHWPALRVRTVPRRHYPQRDAFAHALGVRLPRPNDETSSQGVDDVRSPNRAGPASNAAGRSGLERQYDDHLSGRPGLRRIVKNRRGEIVTQQRIRDPQPGLDLVVGVDWRLQRSAEDLLDRLIASSSPEHGPRGVGESADASATNDVPPDVNSAGGPQGGAIVMLDVRTGRLLVLADAPRFDVNQLVAPDREEWNALATDLRGPLFLRSTHMALPPGSVFKIVTACAGLHAGVDPDTHIDCRGYLDRPDQHRCLIYRHFGTGHGSTDLARALGQSCNVYFYLMGRRAGPVALADWSHRLGLGERTGVDLPSEATGEIPQPTTNAAGQVDRRWPSSRTLGMAIGQDRVTVTPLQLARMVAAVVNGGRLVSPRLADTPEFDSTDQSTQAIQLASAVDDNDDVLRPTGSIHGVEVPGLTAEMRQAIHAGLVAVVNTPGGTGYQTVRRSDLAIAGKTGTAEAGGGRADHAWFVGYAPAEDPQIAIAVVLEHGGSGGKTAGPVARELLGQALGNGARTDKHP